MTESFQALERIEDQVSKHWKQYPEYRISNVDWLKRAPTAWTARRLKYVGRFIYGAALKSEDRRDGDVDVFGSNGLVGRHHEANTGSPAIVIGRKGSYGKVSWSSASCFVIDTAYFIDKSSCAENLKWLFYALSVLELDKTTMDSAVPGLTREVAHNKRIPIPPLSEQKTIADFLDRETAKIDALIAEKEKLLKLLEEKRTAMISHAVTKGFNPDVKMKDSGVPWLGEIPEHWGTTKLKYCTSHVVDCLHSTPTYVDGAEFPAIRTADVLKGRLNLADARTVTADEYKTRTQRLVPVCDDIVYSREGERFGLAALVPGNVELCLSQRMMHFRARAGMCPAFLMWCLNAEGTYQQAAQDTTGATSPHVNVDTIRNFIVPEPPLEEQKVLAEFVLQKYVDDNRLEARVLDCITLLQERRATLISAAVTGKIDVRGVV